MLAHLAIPLALASSALAWGNSGHQTVGYVAQAFLKPNAQANVHTLLGSYFNYSLGVAATWADSIKYTAGYEWSAPLHFVDANDSPLTGQCSVSETRDCVGNSCIRGCLTVSQKGKQLTIISSRRNRELYRSGRRHELTLQAAV
jgi:hypothetical protein